MPLTSRILLVLAASPALFAPAAAQDLEAGAPLPRYTLLKPGVHRYERNVRLANGTVMPADTWIRDVRFETQDGKPRVHVIQRVRPRMPASASLTLDTWLEAGTLRPLTHERTDVGKHGPSTGRYVFGSEPAYNLDTDVELLETLPLTEGYTVRILFYRPGAATPPQRHDFRVTGSATIAGPAGQRDCWIVRTRYDHPVTFWIARDNQLVVRQETELPNGNVLVTDLVE